MGVTREVLKAGAGRRPKHAECCVLHYVGTFKSNGREFDNSRKKGKPLTFLLGIGSVIKGWVGRPCLTPSV
jgi:FKBP-type peptidyl-prolyl cis-trans isomerase